MTQGFWHPERRERGASAILILNNVGQVCDLPVPGVSGSPAIPAIGWPRWLLELAWNRGAGGPCNRQTEGLPHAGPLWSMRLRREIGHTFPFKMRIAGSA